MDKKSLEKPKNTNKKQANETSENKNFAHMYCIYPLSQNLNKVGEDYAPAEGGTT